MGYEPWSWCRSARTWTWLLKIDCKEKWGMKVGKIRDSVSTAGWRTRQIYISSRVAQFGVTIQIGANIEIPTSPIRRRSVQHTHTCNTDSQKCLGHSTCPSHLRWRSHAPFTVGSNPLPTGMHNLLVTDKWVSNTTTSVSASFCALFSFTRKYIYSCPSNWGAWRRPKGWHQYECGGLA